MMPKHLHVGCGTHILPGWVNLDAIPGPGVDLVADLETGLAVLPDGAFAWAYSSHVIEHLHSDYLPVVLAHLHRALAPGGALTLATISLDGIYHNAFRKGMPAATWNAYLYGNQKTTDSPLMAHRQCFTAASLTDYLHAAGFATVQPWFINQYQAIWDLNDCARSSNHVSLLLEGIK